MSRENATYYRDYDDMAQDMIDSLASRTLPHLSDLQYMYGMSEASRTQAEIVMDRIAADPQLAERFDAAVADFEAEQTTQLS